MKTLIKLFTFTLLLVSLATVRAAPQLDGDQWPSSTSCLSIAAMIFEPERPTGTTGCRYLTLPQEN